MIEAKGKFKHGFNGQRDFTVRLMTADDAIGALEEAIVEHGADVTMLRVRKHELARMISVDGENLTVAQVGGLLAVDYDIANQLSDELEKKLNEPAKENPAG